jgi:formylglycine-generating enzyme required for sulfatase activity
VLAEAMTTKRRIFLAHAREDKPEVRRLYADLKARGLEPWLDEFDLVPGQIWKVEIPNAIRQAGIFLACLSSRSVEKVGYVQNEFRLALSAFGERPPGSIYLVPVRLDECTVPDLQIPDRGLSLQDIHWVDLWQEGGFQRLVGAIEDAFGIAPLSAGAGEQTSTVIPVPEHGAERLAEQQGKPAVGNLAPGRVFRDVDAPWCPELVVIPTGEFMMGSTEAERQWAIKQDAKQKRVASEKPEHRVKIEHRLAIGCYPVTFEEWDRYADDGAWHRSECLKPYRPHDEDWGRGKQPLINVSWDDIQGYLRWLRGKTGHLYRLLSEAEWEYACRAGLKTRYHVGSKITHHDANFGEKVGRTTEVGFYTPNAWGLYDMHGNVWEWVEDCWNNNYHGAPDDGSAWTSGDCSCRVVRGGSWGSPKPNLRSAYRNKRKADDRDNVVGFRVARTLVEHPAKTPAKDIPLNKLDYHNPALSGQVNFDYFNNNGRFSIGRDELLFETQWSKASDSSIHLYSDPPSIAGVAEAPGLQSYEHVEDHAGYDMSSRARTIQEGEHAILKNRFGKYAVLRIIDIKDRTRSDSVDELTFEFRILTDKS